MSEEKEERKTHDKKKKTSKQSDSIYQNCLHFSLLYFKYSKKKI